MTVQTARARKLRLKPYDGQALKRLVEAGMTWLRTNQQTVNALNVFPVPDGDTGTNMVLTMTSAWNEIKDSGEKHVGRMAGMIAKGALMGARGNSGVILSQLWRGFARGLQDLEVIDGPGLVRAFAEARDTAYKGVVKPVEGTILTVAKDSAAAAELALKETQDPIAILEKVIPAADASVENTPELAARPQAGWGRRFRRERSLLYYGGRSPPHPRPAPGCSACHRAAPLRPEFRCRHAGGGGGPGLRGRGRLLPQQGIRAAKVLRPPGGDGHIDPGGRRRRHVSHAYPRAARQTLRARGLCHEHRHHHQGRHGEPHGADGRCQRPHEGRQAGTDQGRAGTDRGRGRFSWRWAQPHLRQPGRGRHR